MKARPSTLPPTVPSISYLEEVDAELRAFVLARRDIMARLAPEPVVLIDELSRTLAAGGKRLRPQFCYWGYRAGGGAETTGIARVGAALELLHTFAVIHDDVMDRSHLRRGEPTAYRHLAAEKGTPEAQDPFGRSAAILAGDLAQAFADELFVSSGFPPPRLLEAFRHFNEMRTQAVAGEFLDLLLARRGHADETEARRVASLKSASYTVVGPLLVGASLAGAEPGIVGALEGYGWALGEAFQLRDDVLGTFGDPAVTGKDRDTDIREGKQTALVAKARRLAGEGPSHAVLERLGRADLMADEIEGIRLAIRESGAVAETVALIDSLAAKAVAALEDAPIAPGVASALRSLADLVALRNA